MRNQLNFNHLEVFFSLAKTLSFSKTALELKIAQPAVSSQIKKLEESFGKQLFLRTRHSVNLTDFGKEIYQNMWPIYKSLCSKVADAINQTGDISGKISFGCLEEIGEQVFIHCLNSFKEKYKTIFFDVRFLKAYEIIEQVKTGELDFGVVPDKLLSENIRSYKILEEEIMLVTTKINEDSPVKKISSIPLVQYRENDPLALYYLKKAFPKSKLNNLNIQFYVNSHKSIIDVIKKNNLYAVLPALSIKEELKNKELVNIGPKTLRSDLFLIHAEQGFMEKKLFVFRKYLREYLKNNY